MESKRIQNAEFVQRVGRIFERAKFLSKYPLKLEGSSGNPLATMDCDLDLLLVGKTGAGKSKTGNTILNKKEFPVSGSTQSVTDTIQWGVRDFNGKVIKVFDAPGILDPRHDKEDDIDIIKQAILLNPKGYNALLFVNKYGQRFTKEDEEALDFLKNAFGPSFVKDYCILVMTNGDTFESDNEGKSFKQWCSDQKGEFSKLLKECKERIVLFDNNTKSEEKRNAQLKNLLVQIHKLQAEGCRYTNEDFKKAGELLKKQLGSDKPMITEDVLIEITLILDRMNAVRKEPNPKKSSPALRNLKERCDKLIETLRAKDKGTGVLGDLIDKVETNKNKIGEAICYVAENKQKIDAVKFREMLKNADLEQSLRLMKQASTSKGESIGTAVTGCVAVVSTGVATATAFTAFSSAASAGAVGLGAGAVASTILLPAAIVIAPLTLLSAFAISRLTKKK